MASQAAARSSGLAIDNPVQLLDAADPRRQRHLPVHLQPARRGTPAPCSAR